MVEEKLLNLATLCMKTMKPKIEIKNIEIISSKKANDIEEKCLSKDADVIVYSLTTGLSWNYREIVWEILRVKYDKGEMKKALGNSYHEVMDNCYLFIAVNYKNNETSTTVAAKDEKWVS